MPTSLITLLILAVSDLIAAVNSCGELPTTSRPVLNRRSFTSELRMTRGISAFSRLTSAAGVLAGAHMPCGDTDSYPGRPVAATVGRPGARSDGCALQTLLRQAIDLYRDRNQGPILTRAKGLFSELTDGAYTGLRADIDDKGEAILIAEHRTRGSLDVASLSDGTVDPLYLALRLAVVQEHNATREPLPFIADDLLLNFDNTRAQAAFRTLSKIAASSQVLFFTHHAHMVDLARAVVPRTMLVEHRLPSTVEIAQVAE